ncbi:hypothetical protein Murmansk-186 [Murmansk poxvirus]|uniref:Interleukin-1-binding protein n=1 Tax=Murmansk poxvirus TaxID=2025359 RepID=A0A223FN14_9POXV|nr:hypothetical protein CKM52_gp186 [Murmansk poxvirus]AST09381.1 hypothetical protein Murmansk-186 [Murmansk poxvirus]
MNLAFLIYFYYLVLQASSNQCINKGAHFITYTEFEKEPVILPCPQSKSIDDIVTWTGNDNIIPIGTNMMLLSPLQSDSGIYVCTIKNDSYCDKMSVNLTIINDIKSHIDHVSYPQVVHTRSSIQMTCPNIDAFVSNTVDVQWKGNHRIRNNRFNIQKGTKFLTINDVRKNDAGYYTCVLKYNYDNKTYNVTRIIKLEVLDKIDRPIIRLPNNVNTSLGNNLTITCRVTTRLSTDVDVFWGGEIIISILMTTIEYMKHIRLQQHLINALLNQC